MTNLLKIAEELKYSLNIDTYFVGGCVRDELLGLPVEDIDVCFANVKNSLMIYPLLGRYCKNLTKQVGAAFPVWIGEVDGKKVDFALARKEKLVGGTRKDFTVETNNVSIQSDLLRRDFTINAIAKNVITGEIIDPYGGVKDLRNNVLDPVSEAFKEDSLRVIRGARFAARFNLTPSEKFYTYAKELGHTDISNERVGMELMKAFKQCPKPSIFFEVLRKAGWLGYHFIELNDLIGVPQSPLHHPEGDAYVHTLHTIDACNEGDWFTRAVMLCHDLGKYTCTTINGIDWIPGVNIEDMKRDFPFMDFKIQSIGHEEASQPFALKMLKRIHFTDHDTIRRIGVLVKLHMTRINISEKVVRRNLRILLENGLHYEQLVEVCRCDVSGRPPLVGYTPDIGQQRAKELIEADHMTPIVTGELLRQHGIIPGPIMGKMVKKALELQDRGTLRKDNWSKVLKQAGFEI